MQANLELDRAVAAGFLDSYEMHLIVLPPAPPGPLVPGPLAVAFQFTVRQGCAVQVKPGPDASIVVVIKFDCSAYTPPRHERTWTREDLRHLQKNAASAYLDAEKISCLIHVLARLLGDPEAISASPWWTRSSRGASSRMSTT